MVGMMRTPILLLLLAACSYAETVTFIEGANAFEIEFVTVGDAGNLTDHVTMPWGEEVTMGAVDYVFGIAKFEISREMIDVVNASTVLNITMRDMEDRGGNRPQMPATGISWTEASYFVNWLNINQGYQPAYCGNWKPNDPGFNPDNHTRSTLTRYVLPSADEWHKAAYYDPEVEDYWTFPTGSNDEPTPVVSGTAPNTAVHRHEVVGEDVLVGPADITQAGGLSPYGVMGMGGNVGEWEETAFDFKNDNIFRDEYGLRGGSWNSNHTPSSLSSSVRGKGPRGLSSSSIGFRVVMLPEPEFRLGDFDIDGEIAASDIDLLSQSSLAGESSYTTRFDLNQDFRVDQADRVYWVERLAGTFFGDANLDKKVDFADFTAMSAAYNGPGGWAQGDFDGDGQVVFSDFITLSMNYNQTAEVASVPEPPSPTLLAFVLCLPGAFRRRRHEQGISVSSCIA